MEIKIITSCVRSKFEKEVNEFLKENQLMIFHEKTVYSVISIADKITGRRIAEYTAIFEAESIKNTQSKDEIAWTLLEKEKLNQLVEALYNSGFGKTLARELKRQLISEKFLRAKLTMTTENRLITWANPKRIDHRSRSVTPIAKEICKVLWGFVPERENVENNRKSNY